MKAFVAVVALTGTLMASGGAYAFDVRSPNPDFEVRERSERLHVQHQWLPGNALASASRPAAKAKRRAPQRTVTTPTATSDPGKPVW